MEHLPSHHAAIQFHQDDVHNDTHWLASPADADDIDIAIINVYSMRAGTHKRGQQNEH